MLRPITVDVVATIMKPSPWLFFSDGRRIEGDPPFPDQHGIELDLLLASTANTVFATNNPVECYDLDVFTKTAATTKPNHGPSVC